MPRLFTAILPPPATVAALREVLDGDPGWPPEGWRPVPPERWHITLCFHGEADPGVLARRLDAAAGGAPAPSLRLAGAVAFARVSAVGGDTGPGGLDALVRAADGDPGSFRPHVTVARTSRRSDAPPTAGPLARFTGRWWRPGEICLVRSDQVSGAPRYTVLHRVPLDLDQCTQ